MVRSVSRVGKAAMEFCLLPSALRSCQFFRKWKSRLYYLAVRGVILLRLLVDWLLTGLATLLTLGLRGNLRDKWVVYGQLLLWHLKGCP